MGLFDESIVEYERAAREFDGRNPRIAKLLRDAADNARAANEVLERAESA